MVEPVPDPLPGGFFHRLSERLRSGVPFAAFIALGLALGLAIASVGASIENDDLERRLERAEATIESLRSELVGHQLPYGERIESRLGCPTAEEVSDLTEVPVRSEMSEDEPCRFSFDSEGQDRLVVCPDDFICTFQLTARRVAVVLGSGVAQVLPIDWAAWRFVPAYDPAARHRDPCRFLADEQEYFAGDIREEEDPARDPAFFSVEPVGFTCLDPASR